MSRRHLFTLLLAVAVQVACSNSDRALESRIAVEARKGAGTLVRIASLTNFAWEDFMSSGHTQRKKPSTRNSGLRGLRQQEPASSDAMESRCSYSCATVPSCATLHKLGARSILLTSRFLAGSRRRRRCLSFALRTVDNLGGCFIWQNPASGLTCRCSRRLPQATCLEPSNRWMPLAAERQHVIRDKRRWD
jgi:hypothetical protein